MKIYSILLYVGTLILLSSCKFLQGVPHRVPSVPAPSVKAPAVAHAPMVIPPQKTVESEPLIPYLPEEVTNIPSITPELFYEQQFKYAILLNVPVEKMQNHAFIEFMEYWYGTKYRMGGHDTTGIDCSSFARTYMKHFYQLELPRSSAEQYNASTRIEKNELQEGDLVFFYTTHRYRVSHVGVYVGNNKFAHASTRQGVIISDLDEPYYLQRYAGAGRMER